MHRWGGGQEHLRRRPAARSHLYVRDLQQQAAADLAGVRPGPCSIGQTHHPAWAPATADRFPPPVRSGSGSCYETYTTHVFLSIKVEWLLPLVSLQALHLLCSRRRSSTGLLGVGYLPAARPLIRRWRRCECCCVLCDVV